MMQTTADKYTIEVISRVKMVLKDPIGGRETEILIDVLTPLMDELFKLGAEYEKKGYKVD